MTTATMMMVDNPSEEWPDIVFFDLETSFLDSHARDQTTNSAIVEFGAVVVCRRTLNLRAAYSTLVRPASPTFISRLAGRSNGITPMAVESAPPFSKIAREVHGLLHERIWAGHNILKFDCPLIKKAFEEIGESSPEAKGYIDTLQLWRERFGNIAGDMKLETIAAYFGLGKQKHRSLEDAMTNLEVFKQCAALLWLELNPPANDLLPDCTLSDGFLDPDEVLINSIGASGSQFSYPGQKMVLMHKDMALKLFCRRLRVRYGLRPTLTGDGRLLLTFVIYASPVLRRVLDECDRVANEVFQKSGSFSDWKRIVTTSDSNPIPTAILRMPARANGVGGSMVGTKIQKRGPCGTIQEPVFTTSESDIAELTNLLKADCFVDAYVTLDPYDYMESAGVRIVAEKLIISGE